ncbi:MAG: succinate dehydrogenase, cytochrome b556 subunit [Pelagibacteraceae bacterium TMED65]|nr:succinate dehydrogenase, cytochrome b556 subunit [Rickettsiales bacterium]OUU52604.1 MAG: succinate dehydrogenase, cytochrome b556 subunit [Pelagibacteraceae bacterium TMED65]
MKKEDLPISPHLQIYKPQITSLLSISHRVTGFALNFSLIILVSGLLCITLGEVYFLLFIEILNTIPLKIILFLTLLGFSYHLLNGIRHIFWDFGFFLENRSSAIFGYVVIIFSLISSVSFSILIGLFS